ncbi:MAG: O-antigen ligase family protein [Solirubrobacteraceae bacterium]|nr:O-antigen ligase family protein [Solirubrobacteraceae bacterium]
MATRRGPQPASDLLGGPLVAAGAAFLALAAAAATIPVLATRPSAIALLAVILATALALARRPLWIVPLYLGFVWAYFPGWLFGGLPSPVELGGLALTAFALWRAAMAPDTGRAVLVVALFLAMPLAISSLVSGTAGGLPGGRFEDLLFLAIAALCVLGVQDVSRALTAIAITGLILGVGALFSVYVTSTSLFPLELDPSGVEAPRAAGPFGESNFFALSLATTIPLQYLLVTRRGWWQLVGIAGIVAVLGGIVAAGSRGSLLAALAGLALSAALMKPSARPSWTVRAAALAALAATALLLPTLQSQITSSTERTVSGRATENRIAMAMFLDHPVTGVGPDQYPVLYRRYSREIGNDPRPSREPHNLYLEVLAEQGLAGALGWLGALLVVGSLVARSGAHRDPVGRALLLALATFGVGSVFLHDSLLRLLYVLIGLTIALSCALPAQRSPGQRAGRPAR